MAIYKARLITLPARYVKNPRKPNEGVVLSVDNVNKTAEVQVGAEVKTFTFEEIEDANK